jgi:hypothetical protein
LSLRFLHMAITASLIGLAVSSHRPVNAQQPSASPASRDATIPSSVLLQPSELLQMMQAPEKPCGIARASLGTQEGATYCHLLRMLSLGPLPEHPARL